MWQIALFSVLLAIVCAVPINDGPESSDVELIVGESIEKYLAQHPEIESLEEFEEIDAQDEGRNVTTVFRWGNRVAGDRLVQTTAFFRQFQHPEDVVARMVYPRDGSTGAIVNMVHIVFQRTRRAASGRLARGGIGQRHVTAYVDTIHTLFVRFNATVYAH